MAAFRKIPRDLARRERRRHRWVFEFLFDVDEDEYQGKLLPIAVYAARYGTDRRVIRRLLRARRVELAAALARDGQRPNGTDTPSKIEGLHAKRHSSGLIESGEKVTAQARHRRA